MKQTEQAIYYRVLSYLALIFDLPLLRLLNYPVSLGLRALFVPALATKLRSEIGLDQEFKLLHRHSVTEASYNIFFSDLDLSILVSFSDLVKTNQICEALQRYRKKFIFIGELEIYTTDEYLLLKKTLQQAGDSYQFLRDLRKLGWIEEDTKYFDSEYHLIKARRAVNKIFKKYQISASAQLGNNISLCSEVMASFLQKLGDTSATGYKMPFIDIFVPYLGFNLSNQPGQSSEKRLYLETDLLLRLLAIIPYQSEDPSIQSAITEIRQQALIKKLYQDLLEIESIVISAVYRARPQVFPWMPGWKSTLDSWRFDAR